MTRMFNEFTSANGTAMPFSGRTFRIMGAALAASFFELLEPVRILVVRLRILVRPQSSSESILLGV